MNRMMTVVLGLVAPVLLQAPVPRHVQAQAAKRAVAPVDTEALMRTRLIEEERRVAGQLTRLRARYLSKAAWADLGDRCNPGALRVFPADTTPPARDSLQRLVEDMESIIVGRGVGSSLATPEARALLRTIVGWEAGIDRPNWDVVAKSATRPAFATGLTGDVPDPRGPGCLPSAAAADTVTFVIPGFADMDFPEAPRPRVKAYFGVEAQRRIRDEFFTAVGQYNPESVLRYIVVAPMVLWSEYAVVGVRRPEERAGVALDGSNRGGAVYLMRRVGTEWRVLSIVRTWGG